LLKQYIKELIKKEEVKDIIDYSSFVVVEKLFNYLKSRNLSAARAIGEKIGVSAFYLDKHHRELATDNVIKSLNISRKSASDIVKENFKHYGKMLAEIAHWKEIYNNFDEFFIPENIEIMENALNEKKGVIILTGHISNWEIAGMGYTKKFGKVNVIVKNIHNKYIDSLIKNIRNTIGANLIGDSNTVFQMMRVLRKGEPVVFVFDQHAPGRQGVFVDFFGRKAATFKVVAMLARKYNIPVIPAYSVRLDNGKFLLHVDDPIAPVITDNLEEDIVVNTQNYTKYIEGIVRKYPEQWFWVHKRWRN